MLIQHVSLSPDSVYNPSFFAAALLLHAPDTCWNQTNDLIWQRKCFSLIRLTNIAHFRKHTDALTWYLSGVWFPKRRLQATLNTCGTGTSAHLDNRQTHLPRWGSLPDVPQVVRCTFTERGWTTSLWHSAPPDDITAPPPSNRLTPTKRTPPDTVNQTDPIYHR